MSKEIVKKYEKDGLKVVWKPNQCIHSEICYKGLSSVFNLNNRPWVDVDGSSKEEIRKQIDKCPSGALSYKSDSENEGKSEDTGQLIVEVSKNGPLMVHGNMIVKNHDGSEVSKSKMTAFCRCGASINKPYCDGSHKKVDFEG